MTRPREYLNYLDPTTSKVWRAALGNDYDFDSVVQFGVNPDVDANTLPEFIWPVGGTFTFPTAAAATSIVSTSTADASSGAGARTVKVTGLDANYKQVTETITLNGTTPVTLASEMLRVNKLEVASAGSGRANAGTVTISIGATVVNAIDVGKGISQTAIYTVPADYDKALIISLFVNYSQAGTNSCDLELWKRMPSGLEQVIISYSVDAQGTSLIDRDLRLGPIVLEPKTDVWFLAPSATGNDAHIGTVWKMLLIKISPS